MTSMQRRVLARVYREDLKGKRYRAVDSGERVTLASLYRARLLERWAWRGKTGEPDAAYEYSLNPAVRNELRAMLNKESPS